MPCEPTSGYVETRHFAAWNWQTSDAVSRVHCRYHSVLARKLAAYPHESWHSRYRLSWQIDQTDQAREAEYRHSVDVRKI